MANNGHGGARPGAGRPSKAKVHAEAIEAADHQIAEKLPRVVKNLEKLANGGFKRVSEVWKPAGLIQIVRTVEVGGPMGPKILRHLEPAFPGVDAKTLVCISRKVEVAEPNLAANVYLADRIMGKPTPHVEVDGVPPSELPDDLRAAIDKVWALDEDEDDMNEALQALAESAPDEADAASL